MILSSEEIVFGKNEIFMAERGWEKNIHYSIKLIKFFYKSDGHTVEAYSAFPAENFEMLPVILWNRGGDNKSGLLEYFTAYSILGEIASWGYNVMASQYRREDEFGGRDIYDVINLFYLAKNLGFENDSFGLEGWSRGGMMCYRILSEIKNVRCAVIVAGLADLISNEKINKQLHRIFKNYFNTEDKSELLRNLKERSAVFFYEKIAPDTPILFIHGTDDNKVLIDDTVEMFNRLRHFNKNTEYSFEVINGGDHFLKKYKKEVSGLKKKWFAKYLKI